jgi:hypothetical protein
MIDVPERTPWADYVAFLLAKTKNLVASSTANIDLLCST